MLSPHDLARSYDRHIAALWCEDLDATRMFAGWLAAFWVDGEAREPADYPDSVSFLAGAGRGIRWYEGDDAIVGYVTGCRSGCYRVPVGAVLPSVRSWRSGVVRCDATPVSLKPGAPGRSPDCRHSGHRPEGKEPA